LFLAAIITRRSRASKQHGSADQNQDDEPERVPFESKQAAVHRLLGRRGRDTGQGKLVATAETDRLAGALVYYFISSFDGKRPGRILAS
jgi:hypothetical protein